MKEEKQIKTIDGTSALRSECRYIKENFYKIGDSNIEGSGQCYLVDGKYWRENTGYIVYDNGTSKYTKKTLDIIEGIIDIEEDNETPVLGYFSPNIAFNVEVFLKDRSSKIVLEETILDNSYYKEKLQNGKFYHISLVKSKVLGYKTITNAQRRGLPYDSKGIMGDNIKIYNKFNNSEPTSFVMKHFEKLKGLTFGFEFETINGNIPLRVTSKLGLLPLRDGSIKGLEYVTIPLSGAKGMQTIIDISKELKKRTEFDTSCSMHLHLGNIPRTKEFIIAFYRVIINIQDEIYKCFPLYKKYSYGIKQKEYTQPLPTLNILPYMDNKITDKNIIDNFNILYKHFSDGQSFKGNFTSLDEVTGHPSDPRGTQKWNIKSRYSIYNIVPLLFGNKQTIECRIHNGTDDSDKMLNFLFLNAAIINFTKENESKILSNYRFSERLDLHYILTKMYPEDDLGYNLFNYFDTRKMNIRNNTQNGDVISDEKNISKSSIKWNRSNNPISIPRDFYKTINNNGGVAELLNRIGNNIKIYNARILEPIAEGILDTPNEE